MSPATSPIFNPKPSDEVATFQVKNLRITGELGVRASRAARHFGMRNPEFIEACVQFALDHMPER